MKGRKLWVILIIVLFSTSIAMLYASDGAKGRPDQRQRDDNLTDPLTEKQLGLKQQALEAQLNGKAHGKSRRSPEGNMLNWPVRARGHLDSAGRIRRFAHNRSPSQIGR